jgi:hypothetical protein
VKRKGRRERRNKSISVIGSAKKKKMMIVIMAALA